MVEVGKKKRGRGRPKKVAKVSAKPELVTEQISNREVVLAELTPEDIASLLPPQVNGTPVAPKGSCSPTEGDVKSVKCLRKRHGEGKGRYFIYNLASERPDMEIFYLNEPLPPVDPSYEEINDLEEIFDVEGP